MIFIAKKELKGKNFFYLLLQEVYGIGAKYAIYLCGRAGVSVKACLQDIPSLSIRKMSRFVLIEGIFEMELKLQIFRDINILKLLKVYRGARHWMRLPARGQNTKNNSRTVKRIIHFSN